MPLPQCNFYTAGFTRCSRRSADGTDYCRTHQTKAEALGARPGEGRCVCVRFIDGMDQWCGQLHREGETICEWHWQRRTAREQREQRDRDRMAAILDAAEEYREQNPMPHWHTVARDVRRRNRLPADDPMRIETHARAWAIARRYFILTTDEPILTFAEFWAGLWFEENPGIWVAEGVELVPPPAAPLPPMGQMGRLAADSQNVHTAVVSKQTNSNVDLLLEDGDDPSYDVLTTVSTWWMVLLPTTKFADYWKVMEDVRFWYEKRTCKATGDFLYRRVFNGLTSKILLATDEKRELHVELARRFWEECQDAIGMCCEGHISRLANVLVGFDETFRPPVPVGEILQTKIAAIAGLKISHKLKLQKAIAVMDELSVPVADREPWLEALEA